MAPDGHLKSWAHAKAFMTDARAHISEAGEGVCSDQIEVCEKYIEHNQLELALNILDEIVEVTECESPRMLELMAKAALCMGLIDRSRQYDDRLTEWRGWEYHTKIK